MDTLNLKILPKYARKEIQDFYDFLLMKYGKLEKKVPSKNKRPYALAKGEFEVPDSFNEPLPDNETGNFYQ